MYKLFLTALAGLLVACTQNSSEALQISESQPSVQIEDISPITIDRVGNQAGQTLVLIPGLASDKSVWNETVNAFSDYDIRLVQVGGFAGAVAPDGQSIEKVSAAIIEHLNDTPGQNTTLIGHSLGGYLSLNIALEAPDLIDEIIVVDSLPYLAGMMMPGATPEQAAQMAQGMSAQMKAMSKAQFQAQQKMGLARLVKDKSYLPTLESWSETSEQAVIADLISALLSADLRNDLSSLTIPTTVLMAYDPSMGVPQVQLKSLFEAQYSQAPDVKIEVIQDSYHFIMIDQTEVFKEVIRNILEN